MGGFNIKHIEQHIAWLNITPYTDNTRFLALCLFVVACRASESSWPPLSEKSLLDTICRTWQWVCVFFSDLQWGFQHAVTQWLLETVWLKSAIWSKISVRHFRPQNERHHPVFSFELGKQIREAFWAFQTNVILVFLQQRSAGRLKRNAFQAFQRMHKNKDKLTDCFISLPLFDANRNKLKGSISSP